MVGMVIEKLGKSGENDVAAPNRPGFVPIMDKKPGREK